MMLSFYGAKISTMVPSFSLLVFIAIIVVLSSFSSSVNGDETAARSKNDYTKLKMPEDATLRRKTMTKNSEKGLTFSGMNNNNLTSYDHDDALLTGNITCGACLSVYEGDNAYINARLWKTTEDPDEYMKSADNKISIVKVNSPGFLSYSGAKTHDPTVFLFWDIFESKDDFDAAREESDAARDLLDFDEELLVEYEGTIYWSGSDDDCINENHAGKFMAMRMFEVEDEKILTTSAPALFEEWVEMDTFDYYLNTRGLAKDVTTEDGMISTMYINVFSNLEDTKEAATLAIQSINPMSKLLIAVVGEIVFDHNCVDVYDSDDEDDDNDDDDDADAECITIDELVCGFKEFTSLCELLTIVFLDGMGDDSITIFAPTNEAFDKASTLFDGSDLSTEQMESIVLFHAMEGKFTSYDLVCSEKYTMLSGDTSRFVCANDGLFQRGGGNTKVGAPKIIDADIIVCNDSILHVVDEVLLPNWLNKATTVTGSRSLENTL